MMAELRTKSQITIPKGIVLKLGLSQGDKFDVFERDGVIHLVPVAVYPKQYVENLEHDIEQMRSNTHDGNLGVFHSVSATLDSLNNQ